MIDFFFDFHIGIHFKPLFDPRQQLFRIERLGKIVIPFEAEAFQAVVFVRTVGKEKDQDMAIVFPYLFCDLKTIQTRHIDIQKDKIRLNNRKLFESHHPVSGISHIIPFFFKKTFEEKWIFQIIICKKYF